MLRNFLLKTEFVKTVRLIQKNWAVNYKYHGGISAIVRCLYGLAKVQSGFYSWRMNITPKVDCVTFTILPQTAAIWASFIKQAIPTRPWQLLIGDCSGGMHYNSLNTTGSAKIISLLNYPHGEKLDLFLKRVCKAEYVVVSDDDMFWLNDIPWKWALSQFNRNSNIAVVSLAPRDYISGVLEGKVKQPMGSYSLIIRRDIWLREELSFQIFHPIPGAYRHYDTADLAHVELLKRGYEVVIAPQDVQAQIAGFKGISQWMLRIRKHSGEISHLLQGQPGRQRVALSAILAAKGLATLAAELLLTKGDTSFAPPPYLKKAERICEDFLDNETIRDIRSHVEDTLGKLHFVLKSHKFSSK